MVAPVFVPLQAVHEKLETSEERARELYDCNKRLEDHIHDLESRKRAPLYQKRQVRSTLRAACWRHTPFSDCLPDNCVGTSSCTRDCLAHGSSSFCLVTPTSYVLCCVLHVPAGGGAQGGHRQGCRG